MSERVFAVIDGALVTNTFVGDDEFADFLRPEHDQIIEVTDLDPRPGVAWTLSSDGFRPPSPFDSWLWVEGAWRAPVERPELPGTWHWDEASLSWVLSE